MIKLTTFKVGFKSTLFPPAVLHDLYKEQKRKVLLNHSKKLKTYQNRTTISTLQAFIVNCISTNWSSDFTKSIYLSVEIRMSTNSLLNCTCKCHKNLWAVFVSQVVR